MSAAALLALSACGGADTAKKDAETTAEIITITDETESITESVSEEEIFIPTSYNLLDEGKVTEYKNQHQSGMLSIRISISQECAGHMRLQQLQSLHLS